MRKCLIQDQRLDWGDAGNSDQRRELGFGSGFNSRDLEENFSYDTMSRLTG
ncbi:hypothetical protein [Marinimicrobium alkaliphilum]|uniref:hypothetical protein n=1 Tax=Marinimicrobium alkaliphilum TaxID=2202654 RepID=UPI001300AB29|nr:hypothetical protein [Marinimicrobium alkaliphilum]